LPTAKPPATTIFIETGACSERVGDSKSADAIEQLLEEGDVGGDAGWGRWVDDEGAGLGEVPDEDADDADGDREPARELGEGRRGVAELDDALRFGGVGPGCRADLGDGGADGGVERERRSGGSGATAGEDVGADDSGEARFGATLAHRVP